MFDAAIRATNVIDIEIYEKKCNLDLVNLVDPIEYSNIINSNNFTSILTLFSNSSASDENNTDNKESGAIFHKLNIVSVFIGLFIIFI